MRSIIVLLIIPTSVYSQTGDSFRELKTDNIPVDTSYVYGLPYEKGKSHFLIQGNGGWMSHKGEIALDFKVRKGTKICAMREGTVMEIKEDSNQGGLKQKYFSSGNYILVRHQDNSYGWYFHLKKDGVLVEAGDKIEKGQFIGLSGNTGYSAFPHLHVEVVIEDAGHYTQIPMRFQLQKGIHYLKPGRYYRNR